MQEIKRLDDLLERDARRLDIERRPERQSHLERQIDATAEDIRRAFGSDRREVPLRAKLIDKA